jgi:hypothetical protein
MDEQTAEPVQALRASWLIFHVGSEPCGFFLEKVDFLRKSGFLEKKWILKK